MARQITLSVLGLISVSALPSMNAFAGPVRKCDELAAMLFGWRRARLRSCLSAEAYFPIVLTRGRRDSGNLRRSAGLTRAGEIGAGPLSFSEAVPAGLSNS